MNNLSVSFAQQQPVSASGTFVSLATASQAPKITWIAEPNTLYTLIMYDIDTPYPAPNNTYSPFLHWLIVNISGGTNVGKGQTLVSYMGPDPPQDSPNHTYVITVYQQPHQIAMTQTDRDWYLQQRPSFELQTFIDQFNLRQYEQVCFKSGYVQAFSTPRKGTVSAVKKEKPRPTQIEGYTYSPAEQDIKTWTKNPAAYGYMIPGAPLDETKQKVCRCVLKVAAQNPKWCNEEQAWFAKREGRTCYNPYAVCVSSVGAPYPGCSAWYNFPGIPLNQLMAYAQLRQIPVPKDISTPDGKDKLLKNIALYICSKRRIEGKQDLFCGLMSEEKMSQELKKELE